MKKSRRAAARTPKRIVTTVGELISAAYGAADGLGHERLHRAADILSSASLARCMSRQLHFIR